MYVFDLTGRAILDGAAHVPSCGTGGLYPHSESPSTIYSDATRHLDLLQTARLESLTSSTSQIASEQLLQALLLEK
jgi:hypothetical protein